MFPFNFNAKFSGPHGKWQKAKRQKWTLNLKKRLCDVTHRTATRQCKDKGRQSSLFLLHGCHHGSTLRSSRITRLVCCIKVTTTRETEEPLSDERSVGVLEDELREQCFRSLSAGSVMDLPNYPIGTLIAFF
ncbi:hypothetical protein F2P81_022578 [Scophthalmus maximus]|uniref:Uncharacterized protein n=1 Tax=Scophthalmus maximus TaxID=52904 RepID=A0A6A4RYK2_SCOMX|nr:hypothetical protein F2P81_022578 [Scophthalmus maximus]